METLAARPDTAVAIVSGRDLGDVRARAPVAGAIHAGCHGLEIEGPGLAFVHPEAAACRPLLAEAAETLAAALASLRGVELEAKALAVAVHYRRARPSDLTEVFYQVERVYEAHAERLALRHGKKVIELVPDVAWNKGECALWIRDRCAQGLSREPAVVYLGDDLTDEDAFQALRGKATTVRVGPGPRTSAAIRWVADVTAAGRFLQALARGLEGTPAAPGGPGELEPRAAG
jgi:trehalose-phosphatase